MTKVEVCSYCSNEIGGVASGEDESLKYCHHCQLIAEGLGATKMITEEEYEAAQL